jgi:hypothetical protein
MMTEPPPPPPSPEVPPSPPGKARITIELKRSELKTFLFLLPDYALEYLQVEFPDADGDV